jgi:uncharacterized protein YyaL (SSP411 family)
MANRLSRESSPYLRQHAENPVEWYPWGDEAFAEARRDGRPILLSVGYSSCHWCHVMERESFEDPATADLMNRWFVNVKVDREERPDVDALYMRAVQSLTGHGGWPMTVFLTPDGEPFYGGTYYPPEPRHGMPSFRQVLEAVRRAWEGDPEKVSGHARDLRDLLARSMAPRGPGSDAGAEPGAGSPSPALSPGLLDTAAQTLLTRFDPVHGGFGGAPKFPQPMNLDFLLTYHLRTGAAMALQAVTHTLTRMARGGIRDHLGGGFHRYSVDARWLVPHFEKMLYDNALLLGTYLEAWKLTGEPLFRDVAEETGDYIVTDLQEAAGGFLSARDADSEGEEGVFYLWSPDQVRAVLGPEDGELFCRVYDVSQAGNFEGTNILHQPHELEALARSHDLESGELAARLTDMKGRLLEARDRREHPYRDEKVLASWSGLAIRSLAAGGVALNREDWVASAVRAGRYLLESHLRGEILLRTSVGGEARIPGFLEDYASVGLAFLGLHGATLDPAWIQAAERLAGGIADRFYDPDQGVFFDAPADGEALVVRPRDPSDNAVPSGSSMAVELLLRLGHIMDRAEWTDMALSALRAETLGLIRFPAGFGRMLQNADLALEPAEDLVLAGSPSGPEIRALQQAAAADYHPRLNVLAAGTPDVPAAQHPVPEDGGAVAWVCRDLTCLPPVREPGELARVLGVRDQGS